VAADRPGVGNGFELLGGGAVEDEDEDEGGWAFDSLFLLLESLRFSCNSNEDTRFGRVKKNRIYQRLLEAFHDWMDDQRTEKVEAILCFPCSRW
jgi:hypothetical protein